MIGAGTRPLVVGIASRIGGRRAMPETADRKLRLEASYHRLCAAFRTKPDTQEFLTYAETLADLPIEAIERAERRLRREGTGPRQFFPASPMWYQRALEEQIKVLRAGLAAAPAQRRLVAGPAERATQLTAIRRARATGSAGSPRWTSRASCTRWWMPIWSGCSRRRKELI